MSQLSPSCLSSSSASLFGALLLLVGAARLFKRACYLGLCRSHRRGLFINTAANTKIRVPVTATLDQRERRARAHTHTEGIRDLLMRIDIASLTRRHFRNSLSNGSKQLFPRRDLGVRGRTVAVEESYPAKPRIILSVPHAPNPLISHPQPTLTEHWVRKLFSCLYY